MFLSPFDPARRRAMRVLSAGAVGALIGAGLRSARAEGVPVTGDAHHSFVPFDELMTSFVTEHDVPGAALAVAHHSRLVYARGFGFANRERQVPVEPTSLFRIASVSKPITAVAVMQLVEQKKLDLDARFLDLVPMEAAVIEGSEFDPRVREITVRQLLQHTAGWDRDQSGDPIAQPWEVCEALGITPTPTPADIIRYTLGRPLDFAPGERYAYSNVGYLCLGRLIEKFAAKPYQTAVQESVLKPLGIRRMQLGHAQERDRIDGEVRYYDRWERCVRNLVAPPHTAPLQYGGENFGHFEAHGGWIASAVDLVKFASAFDDRERCPILSAGAIRTMWDRPAGRPGWRINGRPRDVYYGCGWDVRHIEDQGFNTFHAGLIMGTSSLLVRRHDGLNWAVLFNTDRTSERPGQPLSSVIDPLIHHAADAVEEWPPHDLFARYL